LRLSIKSFNAETVSVAIGIHPFGRHIGPACKPPLLMFLHIAYRMPKRSVRREESCNRGEFQMTAASSAALKCMARRI
jgi:hypothetical protein